MLPMERKEIRYYREINNLCPLVNCLVSTKTCKMCSFHGEDLYFDLIKTKIYDCDYYDKVIETYEEKQIKCLFERVVL